MKNYDLFDEVFVFTNWGLVKGQICEVLKSGEVYANPPPLTTSLQHPPLYKVKIDVDDDNLCIDHDFYYEAEQLFDSPFDAIRTADKKYAKRLSDTSTPIDGKCTNDPRNKQ